MCQLTEEVLTSYTHFADLKLNSFEILESDNMLKSYLSKDWVRFLIWSLSRVAYSFIKLKEEVLNEEEKVSFSQNNL
jgi:hypothetical protein